MSHDAWFYTEIIVISIFGITAANLWVLIIKNHVYDKFKSAWSHLIITVLFSVFAIFFGFFVFGSHHDCLDTVDEQKWKEREDTRFERILDLYKTNPSDVNKTQLTELDFLYNSSKVPKHHPPFIGGMSGEIVEGVLPKRWESLEEHI